MNNPSVSVIIPVYNVEKYIERCMNSIISQTYTGGIECILIDDCTPDSSCAVVDKVISEYNGSIVFKLLYHETNRGQSTARNTGMQVATGDYIYFLDSDDYITPDCIETLVGYVDKYPNVDIVQGHRTYVIDGEIVEQEYDSQTPEYMDDREAMIRNILFSTAPGQFKVEVWNKLIRTGFLKGNNIQFTEGIIFEEPYFNLIISKFIRSICFCSKSTLFYVSNRVGSTMQTVHKQSNFRSQNSKITNLRNFVAFIDLKVDYCNIYKKYVFSRLLLNYNVSDEQLYNDRVNEQIDQFGLKCTIIERFVITITKCIVRVAPSAKVKNVIIRLLSSVFAS